MGETLQEIPPCNYCLRRPAGSKEHLPGLAALNDGPVFIRYLIAPGGGLRMRAVERVEEDGFVVRTICTRCNTRTGGSYGTAFKKFALQFAASGRLFTPSLERAWITLENIQPLRVLKQLAGMFLAAQRQPLPERWQRVRDFVLRRDMKLPPGEFQVFLYRNTSGIGRIAPLTGMGALLRDFDTLLFSEISWPPLGVVFALSEHPVLAAMKNITDWGQRSFKTVESFSFSVPQYHVEANYPLGFGTPAQVDRWVERNHLMLLLDMPDGDHGPLGISTLVRRRRRA